MVFEFIWSLKHIRNTLVCNKDLFGLSWAAFVPVLPASTLCAVRSCELPTPSSLTCNFGLVPRFVEWNGRVIGADWGRHHPSNVERQLHKIGQAAGSPKGGGEGREKGRASAVRGICSATGSSKDMQQKAFHDGLRCIREGEGRKVRGAGCSRYPFGTDRFCCFVIFHVSQELASSEQNRTCPLKYVIAQREREEGERGRGGRGN